MRLGGFCGMNGMFIPRALRSKLDLELECDGFLNYDRTSKFNDDQTQAINDANQALINA